VEAWREGGRWVARVRLPEWVIEDMAAEGSCEALRQAVQAGEGSGMTSDRLSAQAPHSRTNMHVLEGSVAEIAVGDSRSRRDELREAAVGDLVEFEKTADDYERTGLPLYETSGNLDKLQLAEAAYRAGLPPCVIELTRVTTRDGRDIRQTTLYHYRGPERAADTLPPIERITSARLESWLRETRARRSA